MMPLSAEAARLILNPLPLLGLAIVGIIVVLVIVGWCRRS